MPERLTTRSLREIAKLPEHCRQFARTLADGHLYVKVKQDEQGRWMLGHMPMYDDHFVPEHREWFYVDRTPTRYVLISTLGE